MFRSLQAYLFKPKGCAKALCLILAVVTAVEVTSSSLVDLFHPLAVPPDDLNLIAALKQAEECTTAVRQTSPLVNPPPPQLHFGNPETMSFDCRRRIPHVADFCT